MSTRFSEFDRGFSHTCSMTLCDFRMHVFFYLAGNWRPRSPSHFPKLPWDPSAYPPTFLQGLIE